MGLFGPSKSELRDRIDELESRLEQTADELEFERTQRQVDTLLERAADDRGKPENYDFTQLPQVPQDDDIVSVASYHAIAYKAVDRGIAKLVIPRGAKVVYPNERGVNPLKKLRTDRAFVVEIVGEFHATEYDPSAWQEKAYTHEKSASIRKDTFTYRVGEFVEPEQALSKQTAVSCARGIHFFRTLDEAVKWYRRHA